MLGHHYAFPRAEAMRKRTERMVSSLSRVYLYHQLAVLLCIAVIMSTPVMYYAIQVV